MQVQVTALTCDRLVASVAEATDPVRLLREVPYSEIAVALCASDMPSRRAECAGVSMEEIAGWALQGLGRVGEVKAWWIDRLSRLCSRRGQYDRSDTLWPSLRRRNLAHDVAYRFDGLREAAGLGNRVRHVDVPFWTDEYGITFTVRETERDMEMLTTHGPPPADLTWPL